MNKTTVKISVLAFLGFMTYGYAQQQQQDPKGKVGINTVTPSATMDVRPSAVNASTEATTNEGIIAPKLSKTRIANIATPVEGTLVYATDETTSPISAYTGNDPKVAKITEKGYYYYNGTEWVKAGSEVTDQLWAQRDNGGVTETYLKPANANGDDIYHTKGAFKIFIKSSNGGPEYNLNQYAFDLKRYSDSGRGLNIAFVAGRGSNNSPADSKNGDDLGRITFVPTLTRSSSNPVRFGALINAVAHNVTDYNSFGTKIQFASRTTEEQTQFPSVDMILGNGSLGINIDPTTSASNAKLQVKGNNSGQIVQLINHSNNPVVTFLNDGNTGIGTTTPTEKLEVAGNIKASSLAGSGNRPVYADDTGKLIIGNSTTIRSAWVPDTASNSVQLAITSANGDRTTHPISITDEGMVRATSFQGVNGATIFPDYVFQKYYTGTSSIKADYNFKSLSQVEDFVKANGHLPGYKSAETIKAQGYVDLMETQLTNVEKIEELYLHLMEKEKEVQDLKQRLERLEQLLK